MKPTHDDNTLFSLFYSRNDSLFQCKDWTLAFILRGLYLRSLPALPPFIISDFLRTGWGVRANRGLPPAPARIPMAWGWNTWSWAHGGSGDRKGLFILAAQTKGSLGSLGAFDLPTPTAGSHSATAWKSGS